MSYFVTEVVEDDDTECEGGCAYLADPSSTPAHFFKNHDVGGDFTTNVKLLFENAERSTGIGVSFSYNFVFSLNCLQNSAMFKPKGPSA
jgi:hypothetical protein